MSNSVVGKIKAISAVQTIASASSGKQFQKQSVFLDAGEYNRETGEHYPNDLLLDFINARDGDLTQQFKVCDRVRVFFRLKGRSWDSRTMPGKKEYGVSVSCYRIEPFVTQAEANAPSPQVVQAVQQSMQGQQQAWPQQPAQPAAQPAAPAFAPASPAPASDGLPF